MTGKDLRKIRKDLGLSCKQVADMTYTTKQNISLIENDCETSNLKMWRNYLRLFYNEYITIMKIKEELK